VDEREKSAIEDRLRKRVADCRIFLENTRSFPPRQAAMDEYAKAVEELDNFLSSLSSSPKQQPFEVDGGAEKPPGHCSKRECGTS
jgi:hypothetical protein